MNAPSSALRALRLVAWTAFGAIAYGVLLLAYLFAYHWDLAAQREKAEDKAQLLEIEARNFEVTESKRPEFLAEARSLEAKLSVMNRILPPDPLPEIVTLAFTKLARKAGVALVEATPAAARVVPGEPYAVLPWTIKVRGGLGDLEAFVARLPRMARLLQVRSLVLERPGSGGYQATLSLDAYQHVRGDGEPRVAAGRSCERSEAALFFSSDVVAGVELFGQERSEVPGAVEVVKHYRVAEVLKGRLQPGDSIDVTEACVLRSRPFEFDGYPVPVEFCQLQTEGTRRLLFAQTLSGAPIVLAWETPRLGGSPLACRGSASKEELERAIAWRTQRGAGVQ